MWGLFRDGRLCGLYSGHNVAEESLKLTYPDGLVAVNDAGQNMNEQHWIIFHVHWQLQIISYEVRELRVTGAPMKIDALTHC
jgi:hypothetical protein